MYSGRIESGDSLRYFDATSSQVDFGDSYLDLSARQYIPSTFNPSDPLPLQRADVEPMLIWAATPLYALAKAIPGFGLVHTVWLLNILVTAAAVGVLFVYARVLGASERAAVLVAALFGLCTIAFPYTKTLFREPLVGLWILLAGLSLEKLRASGYRSAGWWLASLAAGAAIALTKATGLAALPALLLVAAPPVRNLSRRWLVGAGALVALVLIAFAALSLIPGLSTRYNFVSRLGGLNTEYFFTALNAYLFSPGASLWGTSPVLLLTVPGALLAWRTGLRRYALAVPALVLTFAFIYAFSSGVHWFGGLSWPPRFLMPTVAFACLGLLPVAMRLTRRPVSRTLWLVVPLIAVSLWVQVCAVSVWPGDYVEALPPDAGGLVEWLPGLYEWDYLRPVVVSRLLLAGAPLDFAWIVADVRALPLVFAAIAALGGLALILRPTRPKPARWLAALLPVCVLAAAVLMLRLLYDRDSRYLAGDTSLHEMLAILNQETHAGDFVLLGSPRYEPFFLNYGKLWSGGRLFVVFKQPGERSSPEQPAEIESDNPDALLHHLTQLLIYNLAQTHERLFVLSDGGPDLWWSARPVERFMAAHYALAASFTTSPLTRLAEFDTTPMPERFAFRGAEQAADLRFGDHIRLAGFTLAAGDTPQAGGLFPVSLYWQTDAPLSGSYTVALFLRTADGGEVAQTDWQPGAGFMPTTTWQAGVGVWDHRALRLPADLPVGEYQLWVKIYDFAPDGTRQDLPVAGSDALDETIGRLPVRITIHP